MIKKSFQFIFIFLFLSSCFEDARHENPLDPQSPSFQYMVEGQVSTVFTPRSAIEQAIIMIEGEEKSAISDNDGRFIMTFDKPGLYRLACNAEGYFPETASIVVSQRHTLNFELNARPEFVQTQLTSHRISRWFPVEDVYYAEALTHVVDLDGPGDIRRVTIDIPLAGTIDTLNIQPESGLYSGRFYDYELPLSSIYDLIGHPLFFKAYNNDSMFVQSDDVFLTRVIETEPRLNSPSAFETVPADSIHFSWERVYLPYNFALRITLFSVDLGLLLEVDRIEGISQTAAGYIYSHTLPPGDYFWTLTIVDSFGNTSRSKESTFTIE